MNKIKSSLIVGLLYFAMVVMTLSLAACAPSQITKDGGVSPQTTEDSSYQSQSTDTVVDVSALSYEISDGEVTIVGCNTSACGVLTVPSTIESYTVTEIDDWAFEDCTGLTSMTIPDSVTWIASRAFSGCTGLSSIVVESGNTTYHSSGNCLIETDSKILIAGCKNSIIPTDGSVTSIGSEAFSGCTGLTSIAIPDSVTKIDDFAFEDCSGLTSVTIPDSVALIESRVFSGCTGLTSIVVESGNTRYHSSGNCLIETDSKILIAGCKNSIIPTDGSVTSIGRDAFSGCTGLTSITIPVSVTEIGIDAFSGCTGLTSISIPNSVTEIGDRAFFYCEGLTSVTIPDSVTETGDHSFSGCTGLTSITIPDSVTEIGDYAFSSCKGLTSVTIPDSITKIDVSAFRGCIKLKDVYYMGTEVQWNRIQINSYNENLTGATVHFNS